MANDRKVFIRGTFLNMLSVMAHCGQCTVRGDLDHTILIGIVEPRVALSISKTAADGILRFQSLQIVHFESINTIRIAECLSILDHLGRIVTSSISHILVIW